jgi:hypothetical protein|tara:strand:- start:3652 stop:3837 length:186 start_codon:yes stop_codon:yes gene_type:complete
MIICKDADGKNILALSDEEFKRLGWDERTLLELNFDGTGWRIEQSNVAAVKYIKLENDYVE